MARTKVQGPSVVGCPTSGRLSPLKKNLRTTSGSQFRPVRNWTIALCRLHPSFPFPPTTVYRALAAIGAASEVIATHSTASKRILNQTPLAAPPMQPAA